MDDENLIELVRQCPVLYDISHPNYMDHSVRQAVWNNIAEQMKEDASYCKTRWNNIRDNYRKSLKKKKAKRGRAAKRMKSYRYSDQLEFIARFFDENDMKRHSEFLQEKLQSINNKKVPDDMLEVREDFPFHSVKIETQTVSRNDGDSNASVNVSSTQAPQNSSVSASFYPVDTFLAAIAPTLKSLDPYHLNLAKSEIFATIQKFELKMLIQQKQHNRSNQRKTFQQQTSNSCTYDSNIYSTTPSPDLSTLDPLQSSTS